MSSVDKFFNLRHTRAEVLVFRLFNTYTVRIWLHVCYNEVNAD
jgi:hypothetical protein